MRNATVSIAGIEKVHEVTKNLAHFKIMLPPGTYKLEVKCHNYEPELLTIRVERDTILYQKVVLRKLQQGREEALIETQEQVSSEGMITTGIRGIYRDSFADT